MKTSGIKIGKEFKPSEALKSLYYLQFFVIMALVTLPWLLPIILFTTLSVGFWISVGALVFVIPIVLIFLVWTPLFFNTIVYKLSKDEIIWKRGVWFKNTGVVPYNRITNVDVKQGPFSRMFGIGSLHIQTAGYSGPNTRGSEITIDGMMNFEELQEMLIKLVHGKKPVAAETYEEGDSESRIVSELVKIRKLLEGKKK